MHKKITEDHSITSEVVVHVCLLVSHVGVNKVHSKNCRAEKSTDYSLTDLME